MTIQTILYFISILLTFVLTGWLAWYAWRQRQLPGSSAYARLALSECLWALAEILSVLSPSAAWALFWFEVRYLFGALIGVFWLVFALEYNSHQDWFSKRLLAGLFILPFITQALLWSNSLHGLWVQHEAAFIQKGPFWIADITARIPGLGYLTHSFYTLLLTLAGIALLLLTAWKMRREFMAQALLLAGAGLTALFFVLNSLFNLLPKMEFNPFTPGLGLSVLLIALAVFRFQFLKRAPAQEGVARLTNLAPLEKRSLAIFILSFILFASGLAAASYLTYQNYEKQFRAQVESQLSAIAALKADELQRWRAERLADAEILHENPAFAALTQKFIETPEDAQAGAQLQAWLDSLRQAYAYERVFLLDTAGVERIASPAAPEPVAAYLTQEAAAILASDQVTFLDFHRDAPGGPIHLTLLVPIYSNPDRSQPLGVLVLRISPDVYLNPFIQRWPVPSASAETLLVRREGEQVVYLNQLRFGQDTALTLRLPLTETDLPATRAVLGETGIIEGVDYRGQTVIADLRAVPDSPWFLVSKMDTAEVFAPLHERLWQTILFFGVLVLAAGAGLVLAWRQQQVNYYRAQLETAEILRKSQEQYRGLLEQAPDGIFIADAGGRYLEVNSSGCALLGYTRDEILSKRISDLVAPEDVAAAPLRLDEMRQGKTLFTERRLIRKDGSLLSVEISGRMLPDGRFQSIVRDITERKQAEDALRESQEKFRIAQDMSPDGFTILRPVRDAQERVVDFTWVYENAAVARLNGTDPEAVVGRRLLELFPGHRGTPFLRAYQQVAESGETFIFESGYSGESMTKPTSFRIVVVPMAGDIAILAQDITERKQAEDALRESRAILQAAMDNSPAGIAVADAPDGKLRYVNNAGLLIRGGDRQSIVDGIGIDKYVASWQILDLDGRPLNPDEVPLARAILFGETNSREFIVRRASDDERIVLGNAAPIKDDAGKVVAAIVIFTDITERKQTEAALRESERKLIEVNYDLKQAQSVARLGNWKWDLKTSSVEWSDEMYNIFGIDKDSYTGRLGDVIAKVIHPDDLHIVLPENAAEFAGNKPQEYRILRAKDGEIRHIWAQAGESILDEQGNPAFLTGIAQDITERKRAEAALRQSELKYRTLFDEMLSGLALHEMLFDESGQPVDYRFLSVNATFEKITGLRAADILGKTVREALPNLEPAWIEQYGQVVLSRQPVQFEDYSGELGKYFEVRAFSPEPGKFATIINDITERRLSEEALRESEARLKLAQQSSNAGWWDWDMTTGQLNWSQELFGLFGLDPETDRATFEAWEQAMHPDDKASAYARLDLAVKNGTYLDSEYRVIQPGGQIKWIRAMGRASYDPEQKPVRMTGICIDITERKQAEETLRASEERFRVIFEQAAVGMALLETKTGRFVRINQTYCDFLGYAPAEMLQKGLQDITYPDDAQANVDHNAQLITGQIRTFSLEKRYVRRDGSIVWGKLTASPLWKPGEPPETYFHIAVVEDITARKQAEERLITSEVRYRRLFEAARDGILILDADTGQVLDVNPFLIEMLGFTHTEFLGKKIWDLGIFKDILASQANFLELQQKDYIHYEDLPLETAHGRRLEVEFIGNVFQVERHRVFQCTIRDITERKQAKEKLIDSETRYRRLFEAARDGILILEEDTGIIMDVNPFLIEMLGLPREEILGKELWELGFFKDIAANKANFLELQQKEYIRYEDLPLETANGRKFHVEFVSNVYQVDHHKVVQCNIRDITERRQAEEALRESEDKFKHVFEYSTVGKSITQFNGGMQVNQALCDLLGYSMPEMQAKKWQEITHPDDIELTQREIETLLSGEKESARFVKRFLHKNGAIVWVDLSSSIRRDKQRQPLYLMSSVLDITERKRAEELLQSYSSRLEAQVMERTRELRNTQEQLVRQERLATLGQLAGSIGHELRNPLGVISNAIYYLKMSQPEASDKVKEYLEIIEKETRTSDKIVTDLLDFTRIKSVDRAPAYVSELVRQTLERYPAPPSVEMTLEIPANLPQIYADPQQVVQVLGNLVANACQAMLQGGKLTVSAAVQSDMICIGIQDTGPGIPPENIDKLFQPLFTTKTKGIGLGLAVSKKLAEANGGRIEVESVVGQGSMFRVYLPVYKE